MHVIEMLLFFPARTKSLTEKKTTTSNKIFTHLSVCVGERDAEVGHGPQDGHEGLDGVAVDHRTVLFEVLGRESTLVDDSGEEMGTMYKCTMYKKDPQLMNICIKFYCTCVVIALKYKYKFSVSFISCLGL